MLYIAESSRFVVQATTSLQNSNAPGCGARLVPSCGEHAQAGGLPFAPLQHSIIVESLSYLYGPKAEYYRDAFDTPYMNPESGRILTRRDRSPKVTGI